MHVFEKLDPILSPLVPCTLTIGNLDGVHLGHQALIRRMRELAPKGTVGVLTFSNHPSYVLKHLQPAPMILSKELKLKALRDLGVDVVYCLEFSTELASMSYEIFLRWVRDAFPFDHLVLGEGAALGHKREGHSVRILRLAEEMGFKAHYLTKLDYEDGPISSGRIRAQILAGALKQAEMMLGRPFQILAEKSEDGWQVPFSQCLPPDGHYVVVVEGADVCELVIRNRILQMNFESLSPKILVSFE